jgi:ketosteroid isomerase-like protein
VSQENTDLVRSLQPPPEADLAVMFRTEGGFALLVQAIGDHFHEDVVIEAAAGPILEELDAVGLEGLKEIWSEWLEPWETYRTEIEEVIDLGDRVLVLVHDFGRRAGGTAEVSVKAGSVWTLRDGKVARVAFYPDREQAMRAAGAA